MLTLLSSMLGFTSSFAPKLFGYLESHQQHKQEMQLMELSARLQKEQHAQRLEEISRETAAAEARALLNHDTLAGRGAPPWVNSVRALVRPTLTLGVLGLYGGLLVTGTDNLLSSGAFAGLEAMVAAVWSFWFGSRAVQKLPGQ